MNLRTQKSNRKAYEQMIRISYKMEVADSILEGLIRAYEFGRLPPWSLSYASPID